VQAQLAEAQAPARPEEVESAQAAVDAAQAQLDRLQEGARPEDVAAAQAALDGARAGLQKVLEGADDQQVIAAQADLANAEAALRQAQAAYDQVSSRDDIGQLPQSLELEQATNAYEAAKARLNDLQQGATAAAVAAAQAQVRQAQAQLEGVQAPARAADLAAAQAELRSAQAQLALVQAGPRPESLTVIEAEVASARAAVEQARASLAQTELVAPFAGTVAQVLPAAGEQVSPGSPLVRLADLSAWQVETDDLTELQVVDVRPGDPVSIKFDALPGLELAGTVSRVQDIGVNKQGDITYTVIIVPASSDPRLRWNMTAEVKIEPAS
jgi:multidrug resistance efflux pump